MDSTALQYENQKLVQQLEAQKSEMHALECKFKELRDEQCSYDKTLISLNKLWNQVLSFVLIWNFLYRPFPLQHVSHYVYVYCSWLMIWFYLEYGLVGIWIICKHLTMKNYQKVAANLINIAFSGSIHFSSDAFLADCLLIVPQNLWSRVLLRRYFFWGSWSQATLEIIVTLVCWNLLKKLLLFGVQQLLLWWNPCKRLFLHSKLEVNLCLQLWMDRSQMKVERVFHIFLLVYSAPKFFTQFPFD